MDRSSCSRSQGHSRRSRRVSSSRAAIAAAASCGSLTRERLLTLGRGGRLHPAGVRRGRRRRVGAVLAVRRGVLLAALRLVLPLLAEVLDERVERLLLVLRGEHLLD